MVTAILFYAFLKKHLEKLRNAEQKAKENDRLKTVFLQNISHEIRTPMNGIMGFAGLLNNGDLAEEQKSQYLDIITKSTDQLLKVVTDVLDIALIETGTNEVYESRIHVNNILDDIYIAFKPLIKQEIIFLLNKGLPDKLCIIYSDEEKIRQVLNNLLSNAIKFTEKGSIKIGYVLMDNELEFFVEDTGIGIAPTDHGKIFEHFRKAEMEISGLYRGVGLGLAICKGNVDLLKGKIWVKSELNKGSIFFFTIPYKIENVSLNVKRKNFKY